MSRDISFTFVVTVTNNQGLLRGTKRKNVKVPHVTPLSTVLLTLDEPSSSRVTIYFFNSKTTYLVR